MTTAKERLVKRLLEGNDDIFTEFVIVGLECSLGDIITEVERLLDIKNLSDAQHTDLNEMYYDSMAIIRVLRYHTRSYYTEETQFLNKAWTKLKGCYF